MFKCIACIFLVILPAFLLHAEDNNADSIWTGNINFLLGSKSLDEDDWEPVEDHGAFGLLIDFKKKTWPISIAIDNIGSAAEEDEGSNEINGSTSELDIGIRKIWEPAGRKIRPFVGGGLALISAELSSKDTNTFVKIEDDDVGAGLWFESGVYWTVTPHFNIGLDLRVSVAEVELFNEDVEVGGATLGLLLGYHF